MRTEAQIRADITREVELRTMARCHASGYGPQSDICESIWKLLAEYGIRPDGHTPLQTYIQRILDGNRRAGFYQPTERPPTLASTNGD